MGDGEVSTTFKVRREKWSDGRYHSVARNKLGHMLSHRHWRDKQSTVTTTQRATENTQRKAYRQRESPRRFTPEETATVEKRRDLVLKQLPGELHRRFQIVCKVITEYGTKWFLSVESDKAYLEKADKDYIKRRLTKEYTPKKRHLAYTEMIVDIIPVLCRDRGTGKKVEF